MTIVPPPPCATPLRFLGSGRRRRFVNCECGRLIKVGFRSLRRAKEQSHSNARSDVADSREYTQAFGQPHRMPLQDLVLSDFGLAGQANAVLTVREALEEAAV